ncbi:O-antigen polymerase [Colwellia ponticola]|nr:O-antigen polymerase [Colwellia ponticola]
MFLVPRKNPLFLYNLWWFLWLLLGYINILNLYVVSLSVYLYITLSIVVMNFTYLTMASSKVRITKLGNLRSPKKLRLCARIFLYAFLVITILLIIRMMFLIGFDLGDYWKARFYYFGLEVPGSGVVISLFPSSIFAGLYHILTSGLLFCFILALGLKHKALLYFTFFNVLIWCVLTTGRDLIFFLLIYMIFAFKDRTLSKNKNVIILVAFSIVLISLFRSDGIEMVFYALISYFTGSIVYFDQLLLSGEPDTFQFGAVTFSQVMPFVYHILGVIIEDAGSRPFIELGGVLSEFVRISDGSPFFDYFNALPTWFFFFYVDFGFWGVVVYPSIIAVLLATLYNSFDSNISEHLALMSFVEASLLWSIFKPQLLDPQYLTIIFIFIFIMVKNERSNSNNSIR